MPKDITVTINRTVQFIVKYNGDSPQDAYEEIKEAFENNTDKLNSLLDESPYKARYEIDNLDKIVMYDNEGNIIKEEDAPEDWKGR